MYDAIYGLKVSALENVNIKYSDSVTVSNNDSLVYVKAPEFIEPVMMNTPRYQVPVDSMYDSIDGKQAGILKNVNTTDSNSIPVTIDVAQSWPYLNAPEYKEPVVVDTSINPDYLKLAQIAFDTVLQTMLEGEKEHGPDEWKSIPSLEHKLHTADHFLKRTQSDIAEDHIAHAMTRCAMIKYLEGSK